MSMSIPFEDLAPEDKFQSEYQGGAEDWLDNDAEPSCHLQIARRHVCQADVRALLPVQLRVTLQQPPRVL